MIAFSEAAAIAVHAMIFLAAAEDRPHALKEISTAYAVSDNHLSKVLQKLVKAGYLVSVKGPKGGYQIASGKRSATLMEIYEAIEGPWQASSCLFSGVRKTPCCCVMRPMLSSINKTFYDFMTSRTIENPC